MLFDLDTRCLGDNYAGNTYHSAYKDVKDFMLANGFVWRQGSTYSSGDDMDKDKCFSVMRKLVKTHPWFLTCARYVWISKAGENIGLPPDLQPL